MERKKAVVLSVLALAALGAVLSRNKNAPAGGNAPSFGGVFSRPAALPVRELPQGFTASAGPGTSRVLRGVFRAGSNETALLRAAAGQLGDYFDGPPQVRMMMADGAGRAQALITAKMDGAHVAGVMVVDAGEGTATLVFDRPQSLRASLAGLASGPAPRTGVPASPPALRTVNFPDNSGSIGIPDGWTVVSAGEGAVHARGPRGEVVTFQNMVGCVIPGTPTATFGTPGQCIAPYSPDPVQALMGMMRPMGADPRVLEAQPAGDPGSAIAVYDFQFNGRAYRAFAYLRSMLPSADSWNWVLYSSYVAAPVDVFPSSFTTLLAIWKSWVADNRVVGDAVQAVAARMRSTSSLLEAGENASRTSSRVHYAYDLWARDSDLIEDTSNNTRGEVNTMHAQELVNALNRQEGSERWRVVPMAEYPY